jgi:hypothetical protein
MHRPKFDPTDPKSLMAFTFYGFLIALLGALTPELIKKPGEWLWVWLLNCVGIGIMLWIYDPLIREWAQKRKLPSHVRLNFPYLQPAKGLVLLVSRGDGAQSARYAVDYHRECLSHVWLVCSSDSQAAAVEIEQHCRATVPGVSISTRKLEDIFYVDCIERAKSLVDQIRKEATRAGLQDQDLICDFTGMNKLVGSGVVLACIRPEHRLQYMEPKKFLPDGRPDPQAGARPVEVAVSYKVELI